MTSIEEMHDMHPVRYLPQYGVDERVVVHEPLDSATLYCFTYDRVQTYVRHCESVQFENSTRPALNVLRAVSFVELTGKLVLAVAKGAPFDTNDELRVLLDYVTCEEFEDLYPDISVLAVPFVTTRPVPLAIYHQERPARLRTIEEQERQRAEERHKQCARDNFPSLSVEEMQAKIASMFGVEGFGCFEDVCYRGIRFTMHSDEHVICEQLHHASK